VLGAVDKPPAETYEQYVERLRAEWAKQGVIFSDAEWAKRFSLPPPVLSTTPSTEVSTEVKSEQSPREVGPSQLGVLGVRKLRRCVPK
jgi:hypothetical protein